MSANIEKSFPLIPRIEFLLCVYLNYFITKELHFRLLFKSIAQWEDESFGLVRTILLQESQSLRILDFSMLNMGNNACFTELLGRLQ